MKASPLFQGTSDGSELFEKQLIFLALAGLKPVSGAASGHWVPTPQGRKTVPDDTAQVERLLTELGLCFRLTLRDFAVVVVVSRDESCLELRDQLIALPDPSPTLSGLLFGYPPSAVMAYSHGEMPTNLEQDSLVQEANTDGFSVFRFSRNWAPEEVRTLMYWRDVLAQYKLA